MAFNIMPMHVGAGGCIFVYYYYTSILWLLCFVHILPKGKLQQNEDKNVTIIP